MRHGKKINPLGRKKAHRESMLANMACSLIEHKRINTTVAKAKELRKFVEPLITKSKDDSTHSRRVVFSYLRSKNAVTELFREVAPKVADRPGGYVRILKTGRRLGDSAEMCMIELVDFNELMLKSASAGKTRRSRRGGKKKTTDSASAPVAAAPAAEVAAEVEEVKTEATPEVAEEVKETPAEATVADEVKDEPSAEEKSADASTDDEAAEGEDKKKEE